MTAGRPGSTMAAVSYPPPLTVDEHRRLFLAMFASEAEAEAFERAALARPDLPAELRPIRAGAPKTVAFYDWLFERLHAWP